MAGWTGLEPATFCVTGRRSNQLSYHPIKFHAAIIVIGTTSVNWCAREAFAYPYFAESSTIQRAHTGSTCRIASLLWSSS